MNMKEFKSKNEALEYVKGNLLKKEFEVALVDGKKTFLCATSIPLEEFLRDDIEAMVTDFLKVMKINTSKAEEIAIDIGADVSSFIEDRLIGMADIDVICAYENY